jgi:hypothetical protein
VQEFQVFRVLESALRMKARADSSSKGWKDFICGEERGKAAWGKARGPGNLWFCGLGWKLGFYSIFVLPGARSVSLINYHLLGPPAVHPSLEGGHIQEREGKIRKLRR